MKLNVLERIVVSEILPKEGSFMNLKLVRTVKEELSFSEEENKALEFNQIGTSLKWKENVIEDKEFNFGEVVTKLIISKLKELDESEDLTENHFSLYEKFIGE